MAKVTARRQDVTFVLELTESEAQYVEAALARVMPANVPAGGDPVWDALDVAMRDVGVSVDRAAIAD